MVSNELIVRLGKAFPKSFINPRTLEFIAHPKGQAYFSLKDVDTYVDLVCKVLEFLSRAASKGEPYCTQKNNRKYQGYMLDGINQFLDVSDFTHDEIDLVYSYLGNRVNHFKTQRFVLSGYNMSILKGNDNAD